MKGSKDGKASLSENNHKFDLNSNESDENLTNSAKKISLALR
jgi:hypothetical protein